MRALALVLTAALLLCAVRIALDAIARQQFQARLDRWTPPKTRKE